MRVPDETKQCVFYLSVGVIQAGELNLTYGGTGFFVSVPTDPPSELMRHVYLVTAKHCVRQANDAGDLYIRLNTRDGSSKPLKVVGDWLYADGTPEDEAVDVAILPWAPPAEEFEYLAWPFAELATPDVIAANSIGIGDDLIVAGLLAGRHGNERNLPIVRSGIIASMPEEPLIDPNSGYEYDAYLAELRSIGGLSGSPVFVFLNPGRVIGNTTKMERRAFLLGLIRGHWDERQTETETPDEGPVIQTLNTGIAVVTPIIEVMKILVRDDVVKVRRRAEQVFRSRNGLTDR